MLVFSAIALSATAALLPEAVVVTDPGLMPQDLRPQVVLPGVMDPLPPFRATLPNGANLPSPPSPDPIVPDAESEDNTWGDSIREDPKDLHRIYFQNVDGLRYDADAIALYVSTMAQLKSRVCLRGEDDRQTERRVRHKSHNCDRR